MDYVKGYAMEKATEMAKKAYSNYMLSRKRKASRARGQRVRGSLAYRRKAWGRRVANPKNYYGSRFPKWKSKGSMNGLQKQVRTIARKVASGTGEHLYRQELVGRVHVSDNVSKHTGIPVNYTTMNETIVSGLKYYNPSIPGTLTTAAGATGTFQKKFHFDKAYTRINLRANYEVPIKVNVYGYMNKDDTSFSVDNALLNGLVDVGNPSLTSTMTYPSDSPQIGQMYKCVISRSFTLQPGQSRNVSWNIGKFTYDPSLVDNHSSTYQRQFKAFQWMVRVEGILGHDNTLDEQGTIQAAVDYNCHNVWLVHYDAGADIKTIVHEDTKDTFTNLGVAVNMPIANNQSYNLVP